MPPSSVDDATYDRSVSDVITSLRSAFRAKEFEGAERLLLEREQKLKDSKLKTKLKLDAVLKELKILTKHCSKLEKELSDEVSRRLEVEEEFRVCQVRVSSLAIEKAQALCKAEEAEEKEKVGREQVMALMVENRRLEEEKDKALAELEGSRKRLSELEERTEGMKERVMKNLDVVGNSRIDKVHNDKEKDYLDSHGKEKEPIGCHSSPEAVLSGEKPVPCMHRSSKSLPTQVIEIIDSDDDFVCPSSELKRKRHSSKNSNGVVVHVDGDRDDDDGVRISTKKKVKHVNDLTYGNRNYFSSIVNSGHRINDSESKAALKCCEEKRATQTAGQNYQGICRDLLNDFQDDGKDISGDSEDMTIDGDYPVLVTRSERRSGEDEVWEFEADMLSAFEKNPELPLKAVCALYRGQTSLSKMSHGSPFLRLGGFNKLDALRGTALAEFLMDGDPQGGLKKSVAELRNHDPEGVDSCKRIAMEQSKQLFEIYQKKADPLFFP